MTPTAKQLTALARRAPCDQAQSSDNEASRADIARYAAVAVVLCAYPESREYPGEGLWTVMIRRVASVGLDRLLAALKRADDPLSAGECPAIGYLPLPYLLTDGSRHYLHPRMPRDECGGPQDALRRAAKGLTWRTVSITRVHLDRSPESLRSGCAQAWKNEIYLFEEHLHSGAGGPVFTHHPTDRRKICIYRVRSAPDRGEFVRAVQLVGLRARSLDDALAGPGPTSSCPNEQGFAVVFAGGQWLEVELGGCWRVLREDLGAGSLGTADRHVLMSELQLH